MYKIIKFQGYDRIGFSSLLFRLWEKKKIFRLFKLNLTSFSSLISHFFEDHRIIEHVYSLFELWLFYLLFWKQLKLLKSEKWSDYRLCERKKELKIHLNRTNSTANSMYVTERRNEIGEKLHARFVKIQRPTLFNRVLLPVDFHFDSILPSHRDFSTRHKIPSLWRRLCRNSLQFYAK